MQKEVQMTDNYKEESYCFESDSVKLYITELSGRMTADFNLNGKTENPTMLLRGGTRTWMKENLPCAEAGSVSRLA